VQNRAMPATVDAVRVVRTVAELRALRAALLEPVGFVATMGALHGGHETLVRRARQECTTVAASIFVNPLQFAPGEDFEKYPRTFAVDVERLAAWGTDVVFAPSTDEMYPPQMECAVEPGPLAAFFEGTKRPGHFRGVATVVLKLFEIVAPQRAYFGWKDAQQLAVVRRMAADFNLPVQVVACPTVREPDGLAMSSRNAYLSDGERAAAPNLQRALRGLAAALSVRGAGLSPALRAAEAMLPPLRLDYLAIVDPEKFVPLDELPPSGPLLAIGAAFAGSTRLIDNAEVRSALA